MNVVIVGAGPVGLYLGCLLRRQGVDCTIIEKRTARSTHSRSIGIHPPALRRMADLGLAEGLVDKGVPVREGLAFAEQESIGTLSFDCLPPPFPFVLAVPQHTTEALLEELFCSMGEDVVRGVAVSGLDPTADPIRIVGKSGSGEQKWQADRVLACDGRHSGIRELLGIGFDGHPYDAHFVMGDFPDSTSFGPRAAVYLGRNGLVESFPLPGGVRRWVARTPVPPQDPDDVLRLLADAVSTRTPFYLPPQECLMTSSFTAERYEADRFFVGGVALAGDAAHVISPIGGQGMNLGWMDADWLAAWSTRGSPLNELSTYDSQRRASFRKAARRSELNMFMGQPGMLLPVRSALARIMVSRPFQGAFARLFTMSRL